MTTPVLGSTNARLGVGITRTRQIPRPRNRFTEVLRTGADVLLAGAGAASGLVGGPLLSAAVGAARAGLRHISGEASGGVPGSGSSGSGLSGTAGSGATGLSSTPSSGSSEIDAMRQLQQEGQTSSLQYLRLQQEMQASNRRFSLASSVLKAKHDTARSVLNNLRV
jgi:hypothetical protein